MAFFWDLIQQFHLWSHDSNIESQSRKTESLDARVAELTRELDETRRALGLLLDWLEIRFNEDINRDGRIGGFAEQEKLRAEQEKLICPKCGFRYKWDGSHCGHCGHTVESPQRIPESGSPAG